MPFWDNLNPFSRSEKKKQDTSITQNTGSVFVQPWQDGKPLFKHYEFEKQLDSNIKWVYRCTQVIADAASSVPFRLYAVETKANPVRLFNTRVIKGDEKDKLIAERKQIGRIVRKEVGPNELVEVIDHTLLDLLDQVNPHMNGADLTVLRWKAELLTGNAYWLKVKNGVGATERLWPLNPAQMGIIPSATEFISGYEYKIGSKKIRFDEDEIIHFKDPTPNDPFFGMAPLAAIVDTVTLQKYMDKFDVDLFYNQAIPQTVLTTDQQLDQDIVDRIKTRWHQLFGFRGGNTGEIAILDANLKPHQLTMNPSDLNYAEGQERIIKEILGVYGVPLTKVDPSQIVSNTEAAEQQFQRDTILPRLLRDEQKRNEKLVSEFDERLVGAYDDPVQADKEFTVKEEDTKIKNGSWTRNEVRARRGEEPLPKEQGDVVPSFQGDEEEIDESEDMAKSIARSVRQRIYTGN